MTINARSEAITSLTLREAVEMVGDIVEYVIVYKCWAFFFSRPDFKHRPLCKHLIWRGFVPLRDVYGRDVIVRHVRSHESNSIDRSPNVFFSYVSRNVIVVDAIAIKCG